MVAGAILPVAIHKNKLYFLFGREGPLDETPGWADFGGGTENGEDPYKTALREGGEELTGFLGDDNDIAKLIKLGGGFYKFVHGTYTIHIFLIHYDENLVKYYNRNHDFLWKRMDNTYLSETKLFEKVEIDWFTVQDMKRRLKEYRSFYQEIVGELLEEMPKIETFLRKKNKKFMKKTVKKSKKSKKTVKNR